MYAHDGNRPRFPVTSQVDTPAERTIRLDAQFPASTFPWGPAILDGPTVGADCRFIWQVNSEPVNSVENVEVDLVPYTGRTRALAGPHGDGVCRRFRDAQSSKMRNSHEMLFRKKRFSGQSGREC